MLGVSELKSNLAKMLQNLDYLKEYYDNPIYKGLKVGNILKSIPDTNDKNLVLLQEILDKVNKLEKNKSYQIKKQSYDIVRYDILIDENSIRGNINLVSTQLEMFGYKVITEDNTIYISDIEPEDLYKIENVLKLDNIQYTKYKVYSESL